MLFLHTVFPQPDVDVNPGHKITVLYLAVDKLAILIQLPEDHRRVFRHVQCNPFGHADTELRIRGTGLRVSEARGFVGAMYRRRAFT